MSTHKANAWIHDGSEREPARYYIFMYGERKLLLGNASPPGSPKTQRPPPALTQNLYNKKLKQRWAYFCDTEILL